MKTILFVCTGNTCRSPMAEAVGRHWLGDRPDVFIASAGVATADGMPPSPEVIHALQRHGIRHEGSSTALTPAMVQGATAIFCMTETHAQMVRAFASDSGGNNNNTPLIERLDPQGDIADPIGSPQQVYDDVLQSLTQLVPLRLQQILGDKPVTTQNLRITLGSDHRGDDVMETIAKALEDDGHQASMLGARGETSRDYPDSAWEVARSVADGDADLGILICGSGNGMCIAANKVPGIRAGLGFSVEAAEMTKRHNNANVLCLSADAMDSETLIAAVRAWIEADFEGDRHNRRVDKIASIEHGNPPVSTDEPVNQG